MARPAAPDPALVARQLIEDARKGIFKSVYLLMGEEPYYTDQVAQVLAETVVPEESRDFNQMICYGADVNADAVMTAARRYPMFAERQLVMVREAQVMKDYEQLAEYCANPLDSTVLVICLRGANADKRRALYKEVQRVGVVLESVPVPDWKVPQWITSYYASLGLKIEEEAGLLLAEFAGSDLTKIAVETHKMLRNLPDGTKAVSVADIEENIGLSRQMSAFELCNALSHRDASRAFKIVSAMSSLKSFSLPAVAAMAYVHFNRLLRYVFLMSSRPGASAAEKNAVGVTPYLQKEYDTARRQWNTRQCMGAISLLKEFDYRGKGGDGGDVDGGQLYKELVAKLLAL